MIYIGIDCHNLEQARAGVARTLIEELRGLVKIPYVRENIRFFLYFKSKVSDDALFDDSIFIKRVLPHIIKPSSLIFYNILLPFYAWLDKVDFCYFPCYMLPLFYFGKAIVTIHDVAYEATPQYFPPYHRFSYHILSRLAASRAAAIVTISDFSKREIIKYYKVPAEKITSIYLAPAEFFKLQEIEKQNLILSVGQIFTRRRVYESILGFEKIANDLPEMKFLIIGRDLTYPPRQINNLCEEVNQRLGREAVIRQERVPSDEKLTELYNSAKLFVYLSEYEGFGIPPVEAMACGAPVLIGRSGVSGEIFGDSAFYVENPRDIDEIAIKMKEAILNEQKRQEIIKRAPKQLKKFNWQEHCETLLVVFKQVYENQS